jgi:large subunit ribosomal protein L32e
MANPKFPRQEYFRYRKLKKKGWRKPRGGQSKARTYLGGKLLSPAIGYRGKAETRGLHPSGYKERLISHVAELEGLDAEKEAVRISGRLGQKKRALILEKAREQGLKVLNGGRRS